MPTAEQLDERVKVKVESLRADKERQETEALTAEAEAELQTEERAERIKAAGAAALVTLSELAEERAALLAELTKDLTDVNVIVNRLCELRAKMLTADRAAREAKLEPDRGVLMPFGIAHDESRLIRLVRESISSKF
jgi:hypothetical protein